MNNNVVINKSAVITEAKKLATEVCSKKMQEFQSRHGGTPQEVAGMAGVLFETEFKSALINLVFPNAFTTEMERDFVESCGGTMIQK